MPSVQVYVNRKLSDVQKHGAASCIIREISAKLGKPKELVAVFFMETTEDMAFPGSMGGVVCPTVQLCAGGVSPGAVLDSCMIGIAAGFQHSGICPSEAVRINVTPPEKGRFCMGVCWYDVADGTLYRGNIRLGAGAAGIRDHRCYPSGDWCSHREYPR